MTNFLTATRVAAGSSTPMSQRKKEESRRLRPWEQGLDSDADSFGGWLRRQREMREVTLRDISDVTKINLRYLEALELNRFSILPAPVFARGFLREYASYVGLDPDEVVNYYMLAQQESPSESSSSGSRSSRLHSSTHWAYGLVVTGAVVALFGLVALVSFWAERRGPVEADLPPTAAPVFSAPPVVPPPEVVAPATPLLVTLDFTENCWVEAILDDGERISELRVQGESLRLEATQSVSLTLGNATGVRIEVNGQPFEVAGGEEVVRDLIITLDSIDGVGSVVDSVRGPGL